jgi:hypothetical protein
MKEMIKMPKNTKAKYLLEDITFDHEEAHLAYTLGSGAASGKNKAFLFKGEDLAEDTLDEDSTEFLKALKKEGSEKLPASAFAYTPDKEKPSTWKLRIDDADHTRSAVAALGKGMMGNKVEIPSKDLKAVKSKVRAAYKKFYPDNEVPNVLKSLEENESGLMLDSDNANSGINKTNKETEMSEITNEELIQKAAEAQVEELLKAKQEELLKAAKAEWEAEQASIALTKSHTDILKGLDFIAEDQVEAIVKATVVEGGESILKALEAAGQAVELSKAAETKAKEDLNKFKEDFSVTEQVQAQVKELSFKDKKAAAVEKALQAQTK